ncbi:hypothetical protein JW962_00300 [Candidatus Dojkabacteria bacterium]|nr:hypothetical protein [Candidatus Dojkabacteria bacterium]
MKKSTVQKLLKHCTLPDILTEKLQRLLTGSPEEVLTPDEESILDALLSEEVVDESKATQTALDEVDKDEKTQINEAKAQAYDDLVAAIETPDAST